MSDTALVEMTPTAAEKVLELSAGEAHREYLHVYPTGQGCCRTMYGLVFMEEATDEFKVFETHGVKIAVKDAFREIVSGVEIDYVETPQGEGFTVMNSRPSEGGGCGCG
ncbi:MAG: iron-sulfur cluster assembly accessory protein [Acidimicrobiia bacterium]|nr:iron-sulfur cluster assembly accessory protein [bacterium]MXX63752.1 iron-sulfur cluster assembly accessory protein [Acidimicrobiia bacterium]MXZ07693.1 iron-sulfur cluster assembly accessory protein [Acidimicrobiia bacterium]MYF26607.1 iron-sulfur cluster assembly accessory protein [Acidimicrobiia bacterium]